MFPSKRYRTYECIPKLVVTVPSARSTIVKKIKWFIIWLYKWSRVTFTELLSAVVKIPWHYHHFPWLLLFSMTFQAWKMVFLNSTTFHDQGAPCVWIVNSAMQKNSASNEGGARAKTIECPVSCAQPTWSFTANQWYQWKMYPPKVTFWRYQPTRCQEPQMGNPNPKTNFGFQKLKLISSILCPT